MLGSTSECTSESYYTTLNTISDDVWWYRQNKCVMWNQFCFMYSCIHVVFPAVSLHIPAHFTLCVFCSVSMKIALYNNILPCSSCSATQTQQAQMHLVPILRSEQQIYLFLSLLWRSLLCLCAAGQKICLSPKKSAVLCLRHILSGPWMPGVTHK